jgi:hypothetical protein
MVDGDVIELHLEQTGGTPDAPSESPTGTLQLTFQHENDFHPKIRLSVRPTTRMVLPMSLVLDVWQISSHGYRFTFDGMHLQGSQTAKSVSLATGVFIICHHG